MSGYLLDTNVPSELTRPRPAEQVERWLQDMDDDELFLSVLSFTEILRGIHRLPDDRQRRKLQEWLDATLRPWFDNRILPITQPIAERLGSLAGERDARGLATPTTDGLIAATALENGLTLVTRNMKDFAGLGVPVFNPWEYGVQTLR